MCGFVLCGIMRLRLLYFCVDGVTDACCVLVLWVEHSLEHMCCYGWSIVWHAESACIMIWVECRLGNEHAVLLWVDHS